MPRGQVIGSFELDYTITGDMSKEDILLELQQIYGVGIDLDIFSIDLGVRVPDNINNIQKWIIENNLNPKTTILEVLPSSLVRSDRDYSSGKGLFNIATLPHGSTSPYWPLLDKFLLQIYDIFVDLGEFDKRDGSESEYFISRKLSSITGNHEAYFSRMLTNMRNGLTSSVSGLTFDNWYFKFKDYIISTISTSSISRGIEKYAGLTAEHGRSLVRLEDLFTKYNLLFGTAKNQYAIEMRRAFSKVKDFFNLDYIKELDSIIGYNRPEHYYGFLHPKKGPKSLDSILNTLVISPLKYIIQSNFGIPLIESDFNLDFVGRTLTIGNIMTINFDVDLSYHILESIDTELIESIADYLEIIKSTFDNILSYWRSNTQLSGIRDSLKKALFSEQFHILSKFIPRFEEITINQLSKLYFPNKREGYLYSLISNIYKYSIDYLTLEKIKLNLLQSDRVGFNNIFNRELTPSEFNYLIPKLIDAIDNFIITFKLDRIPNLQTYRYAFYSNLGYKDKVLINNFISSVLMVSKLEQQGNINLNDLKSIYNIGNAILLLRRMGFPQVNDFALVNDLKEIYHKIYSLFKRDFGIRDPSMSNYRGLSKSEFDRFFYYSQALKSIEEICRYKGYDFVSPSVPGVSLIIALNSKTELIMNAYDLGYWDKKPLADTVDAFHRFYHLSKYLGFDPLLFMELDADEIKKGHRHHFLGVLFRKMSSFVQDHILTTVKFHPSYDAMFSEMGLRQSQAFLEGLLKALEDLIWLTDDRGNFKAVNENDIMAVLQKHLGSLWEVGWQFWTKGKGTNTKTTFEFRNRDLKEFNERRKFILMPDGKIDKDGFQLFLRFKYESYYKDHFLDVVGLNPELFLGSKQDFRFMNIVYIGKHRFDLSNL